MKQVRIAELKARLSEYLRAVRRGETIAVLDRETPIAPQARHRRPAPRGTPELPVIAYVDASVLLRVALEQSNALAEWPRIQQGIASTLVRVESLRMLDRLRLRSHLPDIEVARRRATILAFVDALDVVEVDSVALDRAAQPMPTELGTLDAIHLATALLWRETAGTDLVMATHDAALALGALAHGLRVVGGRAVIIAGDERCIARR